MDEPEEQLDPRLEHALKQLKQAAPRNASTAARGRARFLAEARDMPPRAGWFTLFSRKTSFAMAGAIVLFLVLVIGGSAMTAYAAQESLPNTPLYPVKLFTEDARISLASQPEARLDLILEFADRRVAEIASMGNSQVAVPETVANRLEQELDQALGIAIELPDSKRAQALERLQTRLQRQNQKASEVRVHPTAKGQDIVDRVRGTLQEQLELVEMGKVDPPGLKKKIQETPDKKGPDITVPPSGKEQAPAAPPGQERKSTPEPQNPNDEKGKGTSNGSANGNGKR